MSGMNDMNGLSTDWASLWQQAHFLRPEWLWALLAIPVLLLLLRHQGQRDSGWQQHIDPELLKHLGQGSQGQHSKSRLWAWLLATVLAVIGLAGPSWQQLPQPVIKHTDATVVVLDLSLSMLAEDAKPSRLQQARYKIADILQQRREGETALLVFAGDAFVVAPLTTDTATLQNLLPTLSPQMMPSSGSNPTAATRRAIELIRDGGHQRGHIVLISDGITASQSQAMAKLLRTSGDSLAVIAVGSADGAPIPAEGGGFYKDQAGNILVPKLNAQPLKQLASKVGGRYTALDLSAQDVELLSKGQWQQRQDSEQEASSREFDQWQDSGYWLAIALMPFALLLFRRGAVLGLCVALLPLLPLLNSQEATAQSLQWQNLWQTPDQQGEAAMQSGNHGAAMQLFEDPAWRGAAAYRAGDYATAAMAYSELDTADAHYNRGNALLKQGQLDEAIAAYNSALAQEPQREDAQANLAIAEALKKAQEQQEQEQQNQQGQNGDGQNSEQQGSEQQESDQQSSEQQNSEQQNSDEQGSEEQGAENQSSENQEQQNQQGQNSEQTNQSQDSGSADNQNQSDEQQNQNQGENQDQLDQQLAQQAAEDAQQQNQEQNDQQSEQQEAGLAQAQQQAPSEETQSEEAQSEEEARAAALQASGVPDEEAQALEQWLRKIPDDPSGLLRNKFKYQHYQRQQSAREHQDEIAPY